MRVLPSKAFKKNIKAVFSDNEYLEDMQKREEYLKNITESIQSPFGVMLIQALENIEGQGLATLYESSTSLVTKQAKSDIKVARYLKATILNYVYEEEAFKNAVKQYEEMERGTQNGD